MFLLFLVCWHILMSIYYDKRVLMNRKNKNHCLRSKNIEIWENEKKIDILIGCSL